MHHNLGVHVLAKIFKKFSKVVDGKRRHLLSKLGLNEIFVYSTSKGMAQL